MKCDIIAAGIIAAANNIGLEKPLVVRLEGTNVEAAMELMNNIGIEVTLTSDLDDAATKVIAKV